MKGTRRSPARPSDHCPKKESVEDGRGGDALTWKWYKDDDDPVAHLQPCPPNSSMSSPHRIIHPNKSLLYSQLNLVQATHNAVVPPSTGPPLPPQNRRPPPPLIHQVCLTSHYTSPTAAGRGRMVSPSTTQSHSCPYAVRIFSSCFCTWCSFTSRGRPMFSFHRQRVCCWQRNQVHLQKVSPRVLPPPPVLTCHSDGRRANKKSGMASTQRQVVSTLYRLRGQPLFL